MGLRFQQLWPTFCAASPRGQGLLRDSPHDHGRGPSGEGEKIIAVAGTGKGSDTALVMQAASTQHIRNLRVNEIICKPLNPLNIDELREMRAKDMSPSQWRSQR